MLNKFMYLGAVLLLAGCESTLGPGHPRGIDKYAGDKRRGDIIDRICFDTQINRHRRAEDETAILRRGREEFLVEVNRTCKEMHGAGFIGIVPNEDGQFCLAPGESLWVSLTSAVERANLGPQVCTITVVRKWYGPFDKPPVKSEENPA